MTKEFDINALLDGTLDDLADAPAFAPFPAGTHRAIMKIAQKVINKHPAFEVELRGLETMELSNPADAPIAKDHTTSVAYMMDNDMGQGNFKKLLTTLAEHYGTKSNRALIEEADGAEVLVVTKQRLNKDRTQSYTDIVALQVL